jgi:hypothetical protein
MADSADTSEPVDVHLTAWHVFLVELLQHFTDLRRVEVRDFVKLGTLPLEADVIFLLKNMAEALGGFQHVMQQELDFLEARLRRLTVVEYKSPKDVLTRQSVDTSQVYGLLAKRKFGVEHDRDVALMMMYSHIEKDLFDKLRDDGLPFDKVEEGIRCHRGHLVMYAVNLTTLGRLRPSSPLNLMSSRHQEYSHAPGMDASTLALVEKIRYLITQGKARGMALDKLPGFEEISRDMTEIRRRFLQGMDPKERLEGLGAKERLEGLGAKERLEGLGAQQEDELLALLLAKRQQR